MTTRRRYTPDEDATIMAMYSTHRLSAIAQAIGRSYIGLVMHVARLRRAGLLSLHDRYYQRLWTPEEEEYLAEVWGKMPEQAIAKRLRRTVSALREKAERLSLMQRDNVWTSTEVARLFGVDGKTVLRWRARGWIKARRAPARCGKSRLWDVDDDSLERFVTTHGWAYDWRRMRPGEYLTNLAERTARTDPWLTVDEAARELGWSVARVYRWTLRGLLPHKRRPKQSQHGPWQDRVMIRKSDLQPFLSVYREAVHANRSAAARRGREGECRQEVAS